MFEIYDWYRTQRETEPVCRDELFGGWRVLRYSDVRRVLSDPDAFGSARPAGRRGREGVHDPGEDTMVRSDPPAHRRLRRPAARAFTPHLVEGMAPRIERLAADLLDGALAAAPPGGDLEVVAGIAYPLPLAVIAGLLGISAERGEEFRAWSGAVVSGGTGSPQDRAAIDAMYAYFTSVLADRRRSPGTDLISRLMEDGGEGEPLGERELLNFCALMLVAGHETTTNLIADTVLCLARHPEALDAVRADRALVPGVIEEVLRYASPVQAMVRYARRDVTVAGRLIRAGEVVFPSLGSAHRDGAEFTDPDRFDITRQYGRNISFGHGIHYCLGASLARREADIVLRLLLDRLPGRWIVTGLDFDQGIQRFLFAPRRLSVRAG
ncbi:cytochrome P450 [Actinomadura parmotrematis]|uniref:Cytochrome P450 n=1 Tax=Actinomadura parmotrematis TaxID=2864039 RepID=A0ABS7G3Q8_9ACTN|nr:cytochrome P450 [Actinomadura parmotrematis]MBW8486447.1 cytochrome P450 [Actinomadura parmotrematis]